MPVFKYVATDAFGQRVRGTYKADTKAEVRIHLRNTNLQAISIERSLLHLEITLGAGRVKPKDIIVFTRMFGATQKAAIPIDQSLRTLQDSTSNPTLRRAIQRLLVDIEQGRTLGESMRAQPAVFSQVYANMIEAGEASGTLDTMMGRLADMLERTDAVRRRVKKAMAYPISVVCVAFGAVALMLTFVLPQFVDVFQSSGATLPLMTRIAIGASEVLTGSWHVLVAGVVLTVMGVKAVLRRPEYRLLWDRWLLGAKVFGPIVTKASTARVMKMLSTLVSSGVSIVEALDLVADAGGNAAIAQAVRATRRDVEQGSDIAGPLRRTKLFPALACDMVGIGEQAGELDGMLEKIADFYEEDVNDTIDAALGLIQPIMLVVLGGLVGSVMVALYLPMFDMIGVIGGSE